MILFIWLPNFYDNRCPVLQKGVGNVGKRRGRRSDFPRGGQQFCARCPRGPRVGEVDSHDCSHRALLDGVGLDVFHRQAPGGQTHADPLLQDFTAHAWRRKPSKRKSNAIPESCKHHSAMTETRKTDVPKSHLGNETLNTAGFRLNTGVLVFNSKMRATERTCFPHCLRNNTVLCELPRPRDPQRTANPTLGPLLSARPACLSSVKPSPPRNVAERVKAHTALPRCWTQRLSPRRCVEVKLAENLGIGAKRLRIPRL